MVHAQWYYDGRDEPWTANEPLPDDWMPYDIIECEMIEDAYQNGAHTAILDAYTIDIIKGLQFSNSDRSKQRLVKRILSNKIDYKHRQQRFNYASAPVQKTFSHSGTWMSPFIQEWINRNPYYLYKSSFGFQIAHGIIQEGRLINREREAEYLVRNLRTLPIDELEKNCIHLYTKASQFCIRINEALRNNDLSKVDTLGPFCCILSKALSEASLNRNSGEDRIRCIYRGMLLAKETFEEYQESVGQIRSWLGFSSATKNQELSKIFGNTLFIIEVSSNTSPFFPGKYIAPLSQFPEEEEVLLLPGVEFRIDEVIESKAKDEKNIIYLSLL